MSRTAGLALTVAGVALAAYSFPFVTWVAFAFFLLGLIVAVMGRWWYATRGE